MGQVTSTSQTLMTTGFRSSLHRANATADATASGDSLMPSTAVDATALPVSRTAPHLISIAKVTSTCPTNVRFVSGYQYIEILSLLYPIKRIVNNATA